jgi:carbon monoxide dehydrogenase subunit G
MTAYQESIIVERSPEAVFAYMDDVARESEWQPNIRQAELIPAGTPAVGAKKRYVSEFLGRRLENTYVVREYEPGRRVVYESTPDSAIKAKAKIDLEPVEGGTRVTMAFEGEVGGLLRLVPKSVLERVSRSELQASLRRLKQRLEAQPAS